MITKNIYADLHVHGKLSADSGLDILESISAAEGNIITRNEDGLFVPKNTKSEFYKVMENLDEDEFGNMQEKIDVEHINYNFIMTTVDGDGNKLSIKYKSIDNNQAIVEESVVYKSGDTIYNASLYDYNTNPIVETDLTTYFTRRYNFTNDNSGLKEEETDGEIKVGVKLSDDPENQIKLNNDMGLFVPKQKPVLEPLSVDEDNIIERKDDGLFAKNQGQKVVVKNFKNYEEFNQYFESIITTLPTKTYYLSYPRPSKYTHAVRDVKVEPYMDKVAIIEDTYTYTKTEKDLESVGATSHTRNIRIVGYLPDGSPDFENMVSNTYNMGSAFLSPADFEEDEYGVSSIKVYEHEDNMLMKNGLGLVVFPEFVDEAANNILTRGENGLSATVRVSDDIVEDITSNDSNLLKTDEAVYAKYKATGIVRPNIIKTKEDGSLYALEPNYLSANVVGSFDKDLTIETPLSVAGKLMYVCEGVSQQLAKSTQFRLIVGNNVIALADGTVCTLKYSGEKITVSGEGINENDTIVVIY